MKPTILMFALPTVVYSMAQQTDAAALSQQGASAMKAGRFLEAERVFRQLTAIGPREAGWWGNLGLALHSQAKYKEAVAVLESSLRLRPSPGLSQVLGIDYLKLGQPCQAIAPLERSERRDALTDAYSGCGRHAEAAKLQEQAGQSRAAARSYWQARDYPNARRVFTAVENSHRDEAEFNYEYGDTLLRDAGAEVALPYLERATGIPAARAALGKAYVELARFADAIPHLEASIAIDPDLWLPLSRAYKSLGRDADAARALAEYKKSPQQRE